MDNPITVTGAIVAVCLSLFAIAYQISRVADALLARNKLERHR